MKTKSATAGIALAMVLVSLGCGKSEPPGIRPAGEQKSGKTAALESAAGVIQRNTPAEQLKIYLSGLHVMKNNPHHQMDAHHFCRQVNQDLAQCAIFDGNGANAHLVGIEYIVSEKLFNTLPAQEKNYWHPHNYEILSGQLIAPWVPDAAELELMKDKMNSYGKTWHIWNTGMHDGKGDPLPMGAPELAWSFNRDGEAQPGLLEERDKKQNLDSAAKRKQRSELVKLALPQQGVDAMQKDFPKAGPYPPGVAPLKRP
uniref:DUF1264 domain-containing protein n=1 Tax=Geobacter sp. (strain M21) TaxID=443144 RepID=C6E7D0_GEOSM